MSEDNATDRLVEELETLCDDLIYVSEIDSEVTPVVAEKVNSRSSENYLAALGKANARIHEIEFEEFFKDPAAVHDWFDGVELKRSERFGKLAKFLRENIEELRVFRFGTTNVDVYVVGVGPDGRLIGVRTRAVET